MTTTTEAISAQERVPLWQLLFGIIDKPAVTFKAILAQRTWWMWLVPLLLVIMATAVLLVIQMPYTVELAREQAEQQLAALPAEQAEAARASMEFTLSAPFMVGMGLASAAVVLLIGVLIQALFLYFGALLLGGDDVDFGSFFTFSAWTRLPMAFGALVQAGFIAFSQSAIQRPGLTALVATGDLLRDAQNPLFPLLAQVDLFWLWHLVLVMSGPGLTARLSRGKSFILTLIYGALTLGIAALPSLIFGGMLAR